MIPRVPQPPFVGDEPEHAADFFEIRRNGDGRFVVAAWRGDEALATAVFPSFHEAYRYCRNWVDQHSIDVRFR